MVDAKSNNNPKTKNYGASGTNLARQSKDLASPVAPFFDMYRGFFPLWRKIRDWGWYKDSDTKAVFLELLLTANHKDSDFLGRAIKEGQCVHGLIELSKNLGMSFQSIRTAIKHLKSTNEITIEPTNRFTIYTLNNYFKYLPKNYHANNLLNQQPTNNQQTTNNQLTTSNNDKNNNNDNNKRQKFLSPTLKEVKDYCRERGKGVDPNKWYNFYLSKDWMIGKNKMKNWKAAVNTWEKNPMPTAPTKRPVQIMVIELKAQRYTPDVIKQKLLTEDYSEREIDIALGKKY